MPSVWGSFGKLLWPATRNSNHKLKFLSSYSLLDPKLLMLSPKLAGVHRLAESLSMPEYLSIPNLVRDAKPRVLKSADGRRRRPLKPWTGVAAIVASDDRALVGQRRYNR